MSTVARITIIVVSSVVLFTGLYLTLRPGGPVVIDSGERVVMGTFSRIVAIAADEATARTCIAAACAEQDRIEALMSYHRADSELARMNREAADRPVAVSKDTFEVLREARRFSELSDGAFDVTVGPLMDLWRAAADANRPPSEVELAAARAKTGWRNVILDPNTSTVRFRVQGMKVDLGGIAKGYAVDRSVEVMRQNGAQGGMVDLGGNVRCFGLAPRGRSHWYVAVQDPNIAPADVQPGGPPVVLQIEEGAVSTSGHYRRFVIVAGRRQSHILDPNTGYDNESLASVTVIAPDATAADALSTAVSVLGREKGLQLIEQLPSVEAILIPAGAEAQPVFSPGAGDYIRRDG
jgi:thiamine biosynthesis lipoprotein